VTRARRWPIRALLLLALTAGATSCNSEEPADAGEAGVVKMKIGRETFSLEVADTPKKQQLGLMHRKSMPQDRGMIFVFPDEQERSFWMKNTLIPLDIIYMDAGGKVVSVKQMKPLDETSVPSDGPAKYAVELNQGAAKRAGVAAGDVLTVPEEAREPRGRRRAAAVR
jgi:uncharacterized membrane protein (UPF0127 family)